MPLVSPSDPHQTGFIQPDETGLLTHSKALPAFRIALFVGLRPSQQTLALQAHRLKLYQSSTTATSSLVQWLENTHSETSSANQNADDSETGLLPPHLRLYPLPYPSPHPDG